MTGPIPERFSYRGELDGIRAIAVLAVFYWHCYVLGVIPKVHGALGVDAFFVLSGFLITTLLVQEHDRTGEIRLRHFYGRRALRLLPALFIALIGSWYAASLYRYTRLPYWQEAGAALLYVSNWFTDKMAVLTHTWSLALEEQYYLIWPALLIVCLRRKVSRRALALASLAAVVLVAVVRYAAFGRFEGPLLNAYNSYGRVDGLLLGNAIALAPELWRWAKSNVAMLAAGVGAVAIVAAYDTTDPAYFKGLFTAFVFCIAVLVAHLNERRDGILAKVLRIQPLPALGRISYGFYLFHLPIIAVLFEKEITGYRGAAVALVVALAVSIASYLVIERRALLLKKRFQVEEEPMPAYVSLGKSGLKVSRICLGAMNFGNEQWGCDEPTSAKIIAAFLDAGHNFIDTANTYSGGASEEIVGSRDRDTARRGRPCDQGVPAGQQLPNGWGNSRANLTRSLENSLRRLGTDYVDLYQVPQLGLDGPRRGDDGDARRVRHFEARSATSAARTGTARRSSKASGLPPASVAHRSSRCSRSTHCSSGTSNATSCRPRSATVSACIVWSPLGRWAC